MLTFIEFEKILLEFHKTREMFNELNNMGFDFCEGKFKLEISYETMFEMIISSHYNNKGIEWINWFVFDNYMGEIGLDASENDKPICYSIESLYEYTKQYLKKHE